MADALMIIEQYAKLDIERRQRSGIPEIIFAEGKRRSELASIVERVADTEQRTIVSRLDDSTFDWLRENVDNSVRLERFGQAHAAIVHRGIPKRALQHSTVGILAAGTSDVPVADEVRLVAEEMGCPTIFHYDVGVAGPHRLLVPVRELLQRSVAVCVVVAGMEGALPTVVKSLLPVPVIAVPTSVGYGIGSDGQAALMSMLNTCSLGLTVVNIDNGIGAGATAALIASGARGSLSEKDKHA